VKHQQKKPVNPFEDISFWLNLVCVDFSFGFSETNEKESGKDEIPVKAGDYNITAGSGYARTLIGGLINFS
jgi:hypothetical protein